MVYHVQGEPDSKLGQLAHGGVWSTEAQLLAEIADALNMANWQRAGRRSAPRPKRIPRPWEKPKSTTVGKDAIPISQFDDWWESKRTAKQAKRQARRNAKKPPTSM